MTPDHIVDAHHHIWDLTACKHTWLAEKNTVRFFGDPAPIQRDYHASDFKAEFGNLPVRKSIHIQCGVAVEDSVRETEWVTEQARNHSFPNAIVAFSDLTEPDFEQNLEAHKRSTLLRGIRQIVGRSIEEDRKTGTQGLLLNPHFLQGLKHLARRNLSFDLQLTPPLLAAAAALFGEVPDLKVALCHCGSPSDFSPTGREEWTAGIKALAALPNTICKISGFGMFDHQWTAETITPTILTVIDIFGPDRIAFGSNFPVDKLYASYDEVFGAYLKITGGFSRDERYAMFAGTAERFYNV